MRFRLLVITALLGLLVPADSGTLSPRTSLLGLSEGLYTDRQALLVLKAIIPPSGFGTSSISAGWPTDSRSLDFNPCNVSNATRVATGSMYWPHIICFNQRVTQIKLSGYGISGVDLPVELADLEELKALYLGYNKFSGSLPDLWAGNTAFRSLEMLRLNDNRLSGTLPKWDRRGAFQSLSELYLSNNRLEGALPAAWAGANRPLRWLTILDLSKNLLGRGDPDGLGGYTYLALPDGEADWGTSDRWLSPFPRLKFLNLDKNMFTGPLPNWGKPYAFGSLRQLYLSNNTLTGTLPVAWGARGSFPHLEELRLQWNSLGDPSTKGGLPAEWKRAVPPRSFPALQSLMLFNGNLQVCGADNATRLQGSAAYVITDALGRVYEPGTTIWRICK